LPSSAATRARPEQYFRQVVHADPGNVEARIYLGTLLADAGQDEEACGAP